jgi:glycerophosphoryl diester phosphodiesterase
VEFRKPILIHHKAEYSGQAVPGSLTALRECLEAGAKYIEIDIIPIADGNFVLFHDSALEEGTDGAGLVINKTSAELKKLHYTLNGKTTTEPLGFLSQAAELAARTATFEELQLDLKPYAMLTDGHLAALRDAIRPIKDRVRISSEADWLIRRLHTFDPSLRLGFDPSFYLDIPEEEHGVIACSVLPAGAYGYCDAHPLAWQRWGETAEYLALRAGTLSLLVPPDCCWYLRADLLRQILADGFDFIDYLHRRGEKVAAWTIHENQPQDLEKARYLARAGIDLLTAANAPRLAALMQASGLAVSL